MGRIRLNVATVTTLIPLLTTATAVAQPPGQRTMDRHAWRWHSPTQGSTNFTFQLPVSYGYVPYVGYGQVPYVGYGQVPYTGDYGSVSIYGLQPVYGYSRYSAYGSPSLPIGQSLAATEQAREQYLKNKAMFNEIRREQRNMIEARKAKEADERWERRARNLARADRLPSDLYPRLTAVQLDVTTGHVNWPKSLMRDEYDGGRIRIESALASIVENGPDEKSATEICKTAEQMKKATNSLMAELGFDRYTETRKFLCSLSAEGYYALDE